MRAADGNRLLALVVAIALVAIVYGHTRASELPAVVLPPPTDLVEDARRKTFAALRIPESVDLAPPTLRGIRIATVPGAPPSPKTIATHASSAPRRDAFFPDWYATGSVQLVAAPAANAASAASPGAGNDAAPRPSSTRPGGKVPPAEQCRFGGTILQKSGKPAAIVKDLVTGENVLLSEGESYRGVLLVQLDFYSATFAGPSGEIYRFTAVVGGEKTFPAADVPVAGRGARTDADDLPGGGVKQQGSNGSNED